MVTIDEVAEILSKRSLEYSMINYPDKKEKSIDIIAVNRNKKMIVKILGNKKSSKIKSDLKNIARIGLGIPVIIEDSTEQEIINDRGNILGMNVETFERILDGEKVFLYKTRGGIFVKINSKELKKKREEMGLSLGEVAQALGVSRISIYDYEREDSYVSIDIAEKLVELFGDDILGDVLSGFKVDEKDINLETQTASLSDKIMLNLNEKGYKVVKMNFTAVDIIASKNDKKLLFSVEADNVSKSLRKFNEAKKITSKIKASLIVVVKESKNKKIYEKEDFNTISENEIMNYEFD
ncbi:helix-turn-helix domain-containing protein [Sulfurisphaera tokodaii]|uniref:Putative HTH-type transcriptional regulatory protein STK_12680 n=2 Tax=Sulfurisphaera tokodaii TaxID=111955 RepID=Y1268_SULTO|nr:helix-turn-helix domain-containing protein [Sulfurisphaera tokodaii]Q971W0.2 RecName: Full=Putative HTH-type transcriptional regulatory protein STK_12680 [Sulfurisphaera tokodaii str. 7]BAK54502.1 putative Xre family DNA-binding protein [Sulfurisphaera tokodaii str. 7]HII73290.1 helix-turn-helix domain-containing protein [Sulfurisphaera tokodaii]